MKLGASVFTFTALALNLGADAVITSTYTAEGKNSASTVYAGATRQRFDVGDSRVIQQCDLKRIVQLDDKTKTYTVIPLAPPTGSAAKPDESCKNRQPAVDTGEKKQMLGLLASRWKTVADGCTDGAKTEIDGWYVGLNYTASCELPAAVAGGAPGYPIQYTITTTDKQGKTAAVNYAMADLQLTSSPLDAQLFDIPSGFTEISLQKARALQNPDFVEALGKEKPQGASRIGVASAGNAGPVDNLLVKMLRNAKMEAVPLGSGTDEEVESRATAAKVDYVLRAEVVEVKEGGGSKIGGALGRASTLAGAAPKDAYTATVNYKLVPRGGGAPKLAASAAGSTSQFGIKEAMVLGRVATMFTPMGSMMGPGMGGMLPFMTSVMGSGIVGGGSMGMMGLVDPNVTVMQTTMMAGMPTAGPFGGENQEAAVNSALDKIAKSVAGSLKTPAPAAAPAKPAKKK